MKTNYDFLKELKTQGRLKPLMLTFGLPTNYSSWMEYYEYHLQHPGLSYTELSYYLPATRSTIHRAITFLEKPFEKDI